MIHGFTWELPGLLNVQTLRVTAEALEIDQSKFTDIMTQHTNLTVDQMNNMFSAMTYLSAQEAHSYGMVDEICDVEIPPGVPVWTPS